MAKVYERTENGVTTRVTAEEALAEGQAAMLDRVSDRAHVRTISVDGGHYEITYRDGRHLVLAPSDAEPDCEGHAGEDGDLLSGVNLGTTTYCDGSCNPRRPRYPFTVVVGRTPTHFNDRAAADRCAAQYGATVTVN
ncbi:hypothetical protein [Streptomyces sp. H27-C3]|uniref:hypothetical protein n=1 Tax=Streptomyces sp. H27-C3 TaxID=3046305 RepID=UPI0024BB779F|nr:hypothetical protein [Streptomyces sp. H27-C3]MDJ0465051.1 hypothetical protein [Streptomyces sp. H27-C3]